MTMLVVLSLFALAAVAADVIARLIVAPNRKDRHYEELLESLVEPDPPAILWNPIHRRTLPLWTRRIPRSRESARTCSATSGTWRRRDAFWTPSPRKAVE